MHPAVDPVDAEIGQNAGQFAGTETQMIRIAQVGQPQYAALRQRRFGQTDQIAVECDRYNPPEIGGDLMKRLRHRVDQRRIGALQFDITFLLRSQFGQHFTQQRNTFSGAAIGKTAGNIDAPDGRPVAFFQFDATVAHPIGIGIVGHDHLPVASQMHIAFDPVGPPFPRQTKSRQRVFRRIMRFAPVRYPLDHKKIPSAGVLMKVHQKYTANGIFCNCPERSFGYSTAMRYSQRASC
ncbi:hypothetical protein SDC9_120218 [bioreactor metagenome]|uniref:Uncharacterized protein n=1 Tax=bioreactor metagenome TaxID=1076179 RepID=A0A645C6D7_9ZZZZ